MKDRIVWYGQNSLVPAFWAVSLYRIAHRLDRRGVRFIPCVIDCISRILTDVEIDHHAEIGPGLVVFHGAGVVIGPGVRMGANCVLLQGVTLGLRRPRHDDGLYPTIGHNVHIYAGAVLVGPIVVGDGATIGANAVVTEDVPTGATVVAPRPEIHLRRETASYSGPRNLDSERGAL